MAVPAQLRALLEAGVHFGHQTRRWNPKMRRFIFGEPMITRDYLLGVRDEASNEVIPLPTAARAEPAGLYPTAYRIAYDARSRQFLVGLTEFQRRQ